MQVMQRVNWSSELRHHVERYLLRSGTYQAVVWVFNSATCDMYVEVVAQSQCRFDSG
jgi:hypothetical protein